MIAQRTRRLRALTASVIMSIPATCEDVVDVDEDEPREAVEAPPVAQASKLRRVSGVRDLRHAFRDGEHGPAHFPSVSSLGFSKVCVGFVSQFDMYSRGSLGFLRARHPCQPNPAAIQPVPSLFTSYSSGFGQCSV